MVGVDNHWRMETLEMSHNHEPYKKTEFLDVFYNPEDNTVDFVFEGGLVQTYGIAHIREWKALIARTLQKLQENDLDHQIRVAEKAVEDLKEKREIRKEWNPFDTTS